jgi:hypothetical protein
MDPRASIELHLTLKGEIEMGSIFNSCGYILNLMQHAFVQRSVTVCGSIRFRCHNLCRTNKKRHMHQLHVCMLHTR